MIKYMKLDMVHNKFCMQISIPVLGKVKPAVWIDGGIHAREWIAVSTVVNLIDKVRQLLL